MAYSSAFILAFDTSEAACDVAVICGETVLAQATEPMSKGQAERLMALCGEMMQAAGITAADLSAIGVGVGPGNFTGIRIAVSAARGLALGLGIPAIGVNSFDALRYGHAGPCIASVDARRGQVFAQAFGPGGPEGDPVLIDRTELATRDLLVVGAGGAQPFVPRSEAIARLTCDRYSLPEPRPAPLYLRPADAAPAKDAAPALLS